MTSYRFKRRSFLAGIGGAFGLGAILRNLEASAQGAVSPPRLLVMAWPGGTVAHHLVPRGAARGRFDSKIDPPRGSWDAVSDATRVASVAEAHLSVLVAAIQCDILRVATLQWAYSESQLAFPGLYPGDPDTVYPHMPTAEGISDGSLLDGPPPPAGQDLGSLLVNDAAVGHQYHASFRVE